MKKLLAHSPTRRGAFESATLTLAILFSVLIIVFGGMTILSLVMAPDVNLCGSVLGIVFVITWGVVYSLPVSLLIVTITSVLKSMHSKNGIRHVIISLVFSYVFLIALLFLVFVIVSYLGSGVEFICR